MFMHVNLGGFSFHVSFSKRSGQMFARNIGWLKNAAVDLRIHSIAHRNEHNKNRIRKEACF